VRWVRDGDWSDRRADAGETPEDYISLRRHRSAQPFADRGGPPASIVMMIRINFKDGTSRIAQIEGAIDKRPVVVDLKGAKDR
jgi:hypothetical protein